MIDVIDPTEVSEVLIAGESVWLPVAEMECVVWRLDDSTRSTQGKRGWRITTVDGRVKHVDSRSIVGVQ